MSLLASPSRPTADTKTSNFTKEDFKAFYLRPGNGIAPENLLPRLEKLNHVVDSMHGSFCLERLKALEALAVIGRALVTDSPIAEQNGKGIQVTGNSRDGYKVCMYKVTDNPIVGENNIIGAYVIRPDSSVAGHELNANSMIRTAIHSGRAAYKTLTAAE